ncbi:type 1 glutamine amidotransferase [soil metagenome]
MNGLVVQHIGIEGPGIIADWVRERGGSIATTHLYAGDSLPDLSAVDFLILMGGPMNIYQDRDYPWLRTERAWIKDFLATGRPAVGICLGAQFLADALGGRVTQNPVVEIGWAPVHFSAEGRERFPFLPASQEVIHWHGDTFELPIGSIRLGSSDRCANQGFLYNDRVLGLQFHPEMNREDLTRLVEAEALVPNGEDMLARPDKAYTSAQDLLQQMLDGLKY